MLTLIAATALLTGPSLNKGITFQVVDAGSGQGLPSVHVQAVSSHQKRFFPYILPMCSYWVVCQGPELTTDSGGIVRLDKVDGDQEIRFKADG